ncbi:alpha/beta fold hydrolase [Streptomyces sp. NPDC006450]|uniref:thioesterase II family protein n=1 Tax=Streptomyces sp. NPDC006450 TaxID=3155458 RepID=UPI0033BF6383
MTTTTAITAERDLWIRRFRPARPGAPRLLCLPHAGGSAGFYLPFAQELAPEVNVLAVQYPGRQDRRAEPASLSLTELAEALFRLLDPEDQTPLTLFGHSMGAVVSFELARLLEAAGRPPAHLVASARRGPHLPPGPSFHHLGDAALLAEVSRLNGTDVPPLEDEDILRMALPALRADFRAVESHVHTPGPPLTCPVTAMTGTTDPRVPLRDARTWSTTTRGPFTLSLHPGGHFYLVPRHSEVTTELRSLLTRTGPEPTPHPA